EPVAERPPEIDAVPAAVRGEPPPRHGGPLALLRFMAAHGMLSPKYARLLLRLAWLKLRFGRRLVTDGMCFVGPGVTLEIKRGARLVLGRWSWIGHRCKIRVHEGEVRIGAKRSEEHTSELQSQSNLVCRLLLE